jgi:hypothetical protein
MIDLKKKILNSWNEYYSERLLKLGMKKEAEYMYSRRVFLKRFDRWMRNFRHRRWEKKVNSKADLLNKTKYLTHAFTIWFGKKRDWKELYFNQKVKPKMFYTMQLKAKTISKWKDFLSTARLHKERLNKARNERSKLLLSDTLRIWIKVIHNFSH